MDREVATATPAVKEGNDGGARQRRLRRLAIVEWRRGGREVGGVRDKELSECEG